jgi:cytochrome c oxidase subunit IV
MAHTSHTHGHHEQGHEDHGSNSLYLMVFGGLLVLTLISFLVGNSAALRMNAPGVMWAAMMAVSVAKAMLVILFFMHLKWEANWKYVLTIPCTIMSVFLVLMLVPDIGRRTRYYAEERWVHAAAPASHVYRHVISHHGDETVHAGEQHIEKTKVRQGH